MTHGKQLIRWSDRDKKNLLLGIGAFGVDWLCRKSGNRSRDALYAQIRRLCGGGGLTRGSHTLSEVIEETGYNREQLIRAGKALAQRWARTSRTGAFLLTEDQIELMTAWLQHDYWCSRLRLYACLRCGTVTKPPCSFGACRRCFYTLRRFAIRLGLPFSASKLHAHVVALRDETTDTEKRDFLDLLEARLAQRWAPLEPDLERLAKLTRMDA